MFANLQTGEWGRKMHEDIVDAVHWAVEQRIADAARIAIMGLSYGGYETLVALTSSPDTFACGVDVCGMSSLVTRLRTDPAWYQAGHDFFAKQLGGDDRTEQGRAFLLERSPITHVGAITSPLLIGQGVNDPIVTADESEQVVAAMKQRGQRVTYVVYPDEGHGFARPENQRSFNALTEVFLAQCLEGPYQPIDDDLLGSTLTIPAGVENIDELADIFRGGTPRRPDAGSGPSLPTIPPLKARHSLVCRAHGRAERTLAKAWKTYRSFATDPRWEADRELPVFDAGDPSGVATLSQASGPAGGLDGVSVFRYDRHPRRAFIR